MANQTESLFVDTAAFFARFNERAAEHDRALTVFRGIRTGELRYDPLFTSRHVLAELATLLLRKVSHRAAVAALASARESDSFNVLPVGADRFDRACEQLDRFDDQQISFVDHTSAVLADDRGIDHVFTFDSDDFETMGFTVVPAHTGDACGRRR